VTVYATAAELRANVDIDGATDDAILLSLLTAVSLAIDRFCNRPRGFVALSTAEEDYFVGMGRGYIYIEECTEITNAAVKESITDTTYTDWAATDWFAFRGDPLSPQVNKTPYHGLIVHPGGDYAVFLNGRVNLHTAVPTVAVTAKWGYATTCPETIKTATIAEASRYYKMGESAYADALMNQEMGEMRFFKDMSPVTKMLLINARYVRPTPPK